MQTGRGSPGVELLTGGRGVKGWLRGVELRSGAPPAQQCGELWRAEARLWGAVEGWRSEETEAVSTGNSFQRCGWGNERGERVVMEGGVRWEVGLGLFQWPAGKKQRRVRTRAEEMTEGVISQEMGREHSQRVWPYLGRGSWLCWESRRMGTDVDRAYVCKQVVGSWELFSDGFPVSLWSWREVICRDWGSFRGGGGRLVEENAEGLLQSPTKELE